MLSESAEPIYLNQPTEGTSLAGLVGDHPYLAMKIKAVIQ
jgi:hypothetical protein